MDYLLFFFSCQFSLGPYGIEEKMDSLVITAAGEEKKKKRKKVLYTQNKGAYPKVGLEFRVSTFSEWPFLHLTC